MRPGQQNKRGRGRGSNNGGSSNGGGGSGGGNNNFNRKGGNPLSRSYDSSGPDVKIRGTAQHIAEKYSTLARDAQSAGDRVMAGIPSCTGESPVTLCSVLGTTGNFAAAADPKVAKERRK